MSRALRVVVALATGLAFAAVGCAGGQHIRTAGERAGCIGEFDPAADYFPDKSEVLDATNFTLAYHDSYQVLTVAQPHPGAAPVRYVLVRCGAPAPALTGELAGAQQVTVPVARLYSASTTHLAMITELGQAGVVAGVAAPGQVVDPQIRQRLDTGAAVGYAPGGQTAVEAVIGAHPDVLVTGGLDDSSHPKLRAAGIPVVADAEWLEATALGRAEWVKVFAALTGTEKRAGELYRAIRDDYRRLTEKASGATSADVLAGTMYQGSWSMPTGAGYTGRLILDAGGRYPWAAEPGTQSRQLNFESVYARAGQAPVWLVAADWRTLADAVAADSRYAELAAVRGGQVWSVTGDYWERGVARPDLLLGDLVAILHPQLAPAHRFEFYRRVVA